MLPSEEINVDLREFILERVGCYKERLPHSLVHFCHIYDATKGALTEFQQVDPPNMGLSASQTVS